MILIPPPTRSSKSISHLRSKTKWRSGIGKLAFFRYFSLRLLTDDSYLRRLAIHKLAVALVSFSVWGDLARMHSLCPQMWFSVPA